MVHKTQAYNKFAKKVWYSNEMFRDACLKLNLLYARKFKSPVGFSPFSLPPPLDEAAHIVSLSLLLSVGGGGRHMVEDMVQSDLDLAKEP